MNLTKLRDATYQKIIDSVDAKLWGKGVPYNFAKLNRVKNESATKNGKISMAIGASHDYGDPVIIMVQFLPTLAKNEAWDWNLIATEEYEPRNPSRAIDETLARISPPIPAIETNGNKILLHYAKKRHLPQFSKNKFDLDEYLKNVQEFSEEIVKTIITVTDDREVRDSLRDLRRVRPKKK